MPDNSSSNKRIAKNSIFLSIRMVIVLVISLYTTRVVLRILGVEDYGVYNVVCGFVALFAFLNTSMSNGIQRFINYEYGKNGEEGANKVYCTAVLIQFLLAIIIIVLTESIGLWYLHNKMVIPEGRMLAAEWIFQFSILSFLFVIMQAPYNAVVMAHERMDFYAIVNVLDALLKLGIVFVLPFFSADRLVLYGILMTGISLVNFLIYYLYCKHNFKEIKLRLFFDKQLFRSMLSFSGWNIFGSFSGVMKIQGINLIINFFFGPIVNAARGVAAQVNAGVVGFVSNILTPVRPQVIQSYASGNLNRAMNITFSISKFSLAFLLSMSIPICVEVDFILHLWLGSDIPEHTSAFIIIVLLTSSVEIPMGALATLVHASGRMKNYQLYGSIIKVLSIPFAYFALKLGAVVEWALILVYVFDLIGLFVGMFILSDIMPFNIKKYVTDVFLPLLPVTVSVSLLLILMTKMFNRGMVRCALVCFLGMIIFLLLFYLMATSKDERKLIKNMYLQFKSKLFRI